MGSSDTTPSVEEGLGLGDRFWNKATMSSGDQPDGGDTWHISKRDFNAYMDELDKAINALRQQDMRYALQYSGMSDEQIGKCIDDWINYDRLNGKGEK